MTIKVVDRGVETSTTEGAGPLTLLGNVTGCLTLNAAGLANGESAYATIEAIDANGNLTGEWELGVGTWGTGGIWTRNSVERSSNGDAPVVFGPGTKRVSLGVTASLLAYLRSSIPVNSHSAHYTLTLADAGACLLHPSADVTARTFTIDSNANVPYPVGTMLSFVNQNGAGVLTIAITADTMRWAGSGGAGSRSLAANGAATALKITATEWILMGTGIS